MAHGEAAHGCAEEEQCCPRDGAGETGWPVPRQRPADEDTSSFDELNCITSRPGWAGAHRHGAVRPRARVSRRERPPRRWC